MRPCKPTRSAEKSDRLCSNYSTERLPRNELLRAGKENVLLPLLAEQADPAAAGPAEQRSVQE